MSNHVMKNGLRLNRENPKVYKKLNDMFLNLMIGKRGTNVYLFDKLYGEGTEYDRE